MSRVEADSGDERGGESRRDAAGGRPTGPFGYADFRLLWLTGRSWTATRGLRLLVVSFRLLEVGIVTALVGLSATLAFGGAASLLVTFWIWRAVPGIRGYRYP